MPIAGTGDTKISMLWVVSLARHKTKVESLVVRNQLDWE